MTGGKWPAYSIAGLSLLSSLAATPKLESNGVRVKDYALDVEFFPEQARMSATADISLEPGTALST